MRLKQTIFPVLLLLLTGISSAQSLNLDFASISGNFFQSQTNMVVALGFVLVLCILAIVKVKKSSNEGKRSSNKDRDVHLPEIKSTSTDTIDTTKDFVCEVCNENFNSKSLMIVHREALH